MKKLLMTMVAVVSLSLLALPGFARPPMMGMGGMDSMEHIERMAERLDLSQEQEDALAEIVNSARTESAQDRERLRQIRGEMKTLMEDFDEGRAQSLADEMGQITARQVYSRMSTMARVHSVLTPEQRAELAAMKEKRRERKQERRHKGESR